MGIRLHRVFGARDAGTGGASCTAMRLFGELQQLVSSVVESGSSSRGKRCSESTMTTADACETDRSVVGDEVHHRDDADDDGGWTSVATASSTRKSPKSGVAQNRTAVAGAAFAAACCQRSSRDDAGQVNIAVAA